MWLIGLKICPFQYFPNSLKLGMGMILPAANDNTIIFLFAISEAYFDENVICSADS